MRQTLTRAGVRRAIRAQSRWPGGPYPERFRSEPVRSFWDESPEQAMATNETICPQSEQAYRHRAVEGG